MSTFPSIGSRKLARIVESVGFVLDRKRGSHAIYYRESDHRRVVIPVHAGKDIKPGTLRGIVADMGLTLEQFTKLL